MTPLEAPMSPEERQAREGLASLDAPAADPVFRERLGRAFAAGAIERGRYSELGASDESGSEGDESAAFGDGVAGAGPKILPGPWRRARRWTIGVAAAAAAFAVVTGLNLGPDWHVVAAEGAGTVVVDGHEIPVLHADELAKRLRRGGRVRAGDGSLVVMAGTDLMIEITPGTECALPEAPNRWWSRGARARVESGEWRITTGPGFRGARLAIATPEAAVEVRGTTLAVIREPAGTCVCVFDGTVNVGRAGGELAPVAHGQRRFVFGDGRPLEDAAIRPMESEKLRMFRERRAREAGR